MSHERSLINRVGLGVLAGLGGTGVLGGLQFASQHWLPHTVTPFERAGGVLVVQQLARLLPAATQARVSPRLAAVVGNVLVVSYGLIAGATYGALRQRSGTIHIDGVTFGLGSWAVGYLGWIPLTGFAPPLWQQSRLEVIGPAVRHIGYGIGTVATYRWLQDHMAGLPKHVGASTVQCG